VTGTTIRRYGLSWLLLGSAQVGGTLIAAATFPFLARQLGVETFGIWAYVLAAQACVEIVANPGVTTYAQQQISARRGEAASIIGDVLGLRLVTSIAAAILITLLAWGIEPDPSTRWLIMLYGVGTAFINAWGSEYILVSFELFGARSFQMLTAQGVYALGVFTLIRRPEDVQWLIVASLCGSASAAIFGWTTLSRQGTYPIPVFNPKQWRAILVPGLHYAASTAMSTVYNRSPHLLVRWLLGDAALGFYAAAVRLVEVIKSFINLLQGTLMPRMAQLAHRGESMTRLGDLATAVLAFTTVPLALGGIVSAPVLVPWLLGPSFEKTIMTFQWICPYLLTAPAASFFSGTVLYAMGKYRSYLASTFAGAVVALVIGVALIPVVGVTGAAIAFVAGELAVAVTAYLLGPRDIKRTLARPVVGIAAAGGAAMAVVTASVPQHAVHPLALVAIGAAVYFAVCGALFITMTGWPKPHAA
jgi:O-antigen/teichoic acid export membrane protein